MRKLLSGLFFSGLALFGVQAGAVPSVILGAGNVGINNIVVGVVGNVITIEEFWTSAGMGSLEFRGLDPGVNYTVQKIIHNNTGVGWTRLANELLDPSGNPNDSLDPAVQPAFVPPGFSTSNDFDGLSFAQGSGLPRTSSVFPSVFADELTDARDFLDFFGAVLANGGIDNFMTFGLRDNNADNQPFLLVQRPNASSRVPEPGTLALLGLAFVGFAAMRRRNS